MMNSYLQRRTATYIVRVWLEYLEADPPRWRGEIECPGSEQRYTFTDVEQMVDFLQQKAGMEIRQRKK